MTELKVIEVRHTGNGQSTFARYIDNEGNMAFKHTGLWAEATGELLAKSLGFKAGEYIINVHYN